MVITDGENGGKEVPLSDAARAARERYQETLVNLVSMLIVITGDDEAAYALVGAIQDFIHAICDGRDAARQSPLDLLRAHGFKLDGDNGE